MFKDRYGDENSQSSSSTTGQKSETEEDANNESCQMRINNSNKILKALRKLYLNKEMCDVYLKVGDKEYGAHRLILCASSDVFQVMFMKPEWSEWHESRVELQEMPICETVFHTFLEYFYTGKILITHTNVMPILALADKYIVKSLSQICVMFMCTHVPNAASHNQLFSWLQYSSACCHSKVYDTCQNFIKWNFESVANTPDYSNLDVDLFVSILQQNDIVVHNEMVLYNCVVRWLELQKIKMRRSLAADCVEETFKALVEKVMRHIRFPMMSPRELADLLLSPLIEQHKEFFLERMATGMRYHSGYRDQIRRHAGSEEGRLLFAPRLYTSDNCSAVLTIENFRTVQSYHTSTFVFSSHLSAAEHEAHKVNEWLVDLYPRGVWFRKCFLIVWQGTLEVPQEVLSTVRLSLTCRELSEREMRVRVSVLIYGSRGQVDHVMEVKERVHHFTEQDKVLNIDDLIPFEELNSPAVKMREKDTPYLVGPNRDKLKLNLVISPIR